MDKSDMITTATLAGSFFFLMFIVFTGKIKHKV